MNVKGEPRVRQVQQPMGGLIEACRLRRAAVSSVRRLELLKALSWQRGLFARLEAGARLAQ